MKSLVDEARELSGELAEAQAITRDLATQLINLTTTETAEKAALQRELDELQARQKGLEAENESLKGINEEQFVVSYGKELADKDKLEQTIEDLENQIEDLKELKDEQYSGDIDELLLDVDQQAKNETENETENESLKDKLKHLEAEKLRLQQQLAKQE